MASGAELGDSLIHGQLTSHRGVRQLAIGMPVYNILSELPNPPNTLVGQVLRALGAVATVLTICVRSILAPIPDHIGKRAHTQPE